VRARLGRLGRAVRAVRAVRAAPANTPLRVKLVAALLVLVALALVVIGFVGTTMLRAQLLSRVDAQLTATTHSIGEQPKHGHSPPTGSQPPDGSSYRPTLNTGFFTLLTDPAGNRIGGGDLQVPAGSNQSAPLLPTLTTETAAGLADRAHTVPPAGPGHSWRVLVTPADNGAGTLTVGYSLEQVDGTVSRLVWVDVVVSLAVLVTFGALGYGVVRSSLRGLVKVETTAEAIAAGDLTRRVPELSERTEVGRLAAALNTMLAQVESAFSAQRVSEAGARASEERMRRFVADASHELRTPLTSIRGFAELYRHGGVPDHGGVGRMMDRIESEATRMGVLVEDLLLLARLDQQRPLERRPVDLLELAADAVHDGPAVAPGHRVHLEVAGSDDAPPVVLGDEARLRQVIANLLSNAVTHTPAGSTVTVRVGVAGATAELAVSDDGPGLAPEHAARVFERFYRADAARSRTRGGAGLGLSIVAALVAAHGGTVMLDTAPGEGATFTVRLPLHRAPTPVPPPHPPPSPALSRRSLS